MVAQKTLGRDGVIVLGTEHVGCSKAGTDFHTLHGSDSHQCMGDIGIELVENGLTQSSGDARCNDFHNPTRRIPLCPYRGNAGFHGFGRFVVRAAEGILKNGLRIDAFGADAGKRDGPGPDVNAFLLQDRFGDRSCSHAGCGFPSRGSAAAPPVSNPVFGLIGDVPVPRTKKVGCRAVGGGSGILVGDLDGNGASGGSALENPRKDDGPIRFFAGGTGERRARFAPVQLPLNQGFVKGDTGRAPVDDNTDGRPVGFSPSGDPEEGAKRISGHKRIS